jgi:hypothetical protein
VKSSPFFSLRQAPRAVSRQELQVPLPRDVLHIQLLSFHLLSTFCFQCEPSWFINCTFSFQKAPPKKSEIFPFCFSPRRAPTAVSGRESQVPFPLDILHSQKLSLHLLSTFCFQCLVTLPLLSTSRFAFKVNVSVMSAGVFSVDPSSAHQCSIVWGSTRAASFSRGFTCMKFPWNFIHIFSREF